MYKGDVYGRNHLYLHPAHANQHQGRILSHLASPLPAIRAVLAAFHVCIDRALQTPHRIFLRPSEAGWGLYVARVVSECLVLVWYTRPRNPSADHGPRRTKRSNERTRAPTSKRGIPVSVPLAGRLGRLGADVDIVVIGFAGSFVIYVIAWLDGCTDCDCPGRL